MSQLQFDALAQHWRRETALIASVASRCSHPAYQSIIAMGLDAVPFIIQDLKENGPDDWFWALSRITGDNPITEDIAGDMNKMAEAWLTWAKKENIDG